MALTKVRGSGITSMTISSDGEVTKSLQPAFQVHPTSNQNNLSTGTTTVVFGTERFDVGGNFASNTFTAPVTGKYLFTFSLYLEQVPDDASYIELYIDTSNKDYYHSFDPRGFDQDPIMFSWGMSVVADMDAGDTASVKVVQAGGTTSLDVQTSSHFSGCLLG
jgi:hypothetical protein